MTMIVVVVPAVTTMDMEDVEGAEESQAVHLIHHLVHLHHLIQNPNLHVPALRKAIENMVREEALLYRNLVDKEVGHLVLPLVLPLVHLPLVLLVHHLAHLLLFRGMAFAIITEEFQFI